MASPTVAPTASPTPNGVADSLAGGLVPKRAVAHQDAPAMAPPSSPRAAFIVPRAQTGLRLRKVTSVDLSKLRSLVGNRVPASTVGPASKVGRYLMWSRWRRGFMRRTTDKISLDFVAQQAPLVSLDSATLHRCLLILKTFAHR